MIKAEDFARADGFLTVDPLHDLDNIDIQHVWLNDGRHLMFREQRAGAVVYLKVDTRSGSIAPAFNHDIMAQGLSALLQRDVSPDRLPISRVKSVNELEATLAIDEREARCRIDKAECAFLIQPFDETCAVSPDQSKAICLDDHDLWLRTRNGASTRITFDGDAERAYSAAPQSNTAAVTVRRRGLQLPPRVLWAPDSSAFVSYQLDQSAVQKLTLIDTFPASGSMRPTAETYYNDFPGEPGAVAKLFFFDVDRGEQVDVNLPPLRANFETPIDLGKAVWSPDGRSLRLLEFDVSAKRLRLHLINAETGVVRTLLEEAASAHVGPHPEFAKWPNVRFLSTGDIVWYSERSGWGHLYLIDGRTGKVLRPLTKGEWLVRDILHVNETAGFIYFTASSLKGDPIYERQVFRVDLDGAPPEQLTFEPGDHALFSGKPEGHGVPYIRPWPHTPSFAPDGAAFVDRIVAPDRAPRWLLKSADGETIAPLATGSLDGLPAFTEPERFTAIAADGRTPLEGVLLKPAGFTPAKRYPVIDAIYPGPQTTQTPTAAATGRIQPPALLGQHQALADLGFIVMLIDGRGTPLRSRAFREESLGRLETAGMLSDHVAALEQLGAERPYLDLDRVGIYGVSGGAFATVHAMTRFPEVFKVGVAGAGNYDLRMYLSYWGEIFHGRVDEVDYQKVSALEALHNLEGRLMIAHGLVDDNVHPAQTYRLAQGLIDAGKSFDMLILPKRNHGISRDPYFQRRTQIFFLQHLMNADIDGFPNITPVGGYETSGSE